jgi:hypothetical protein
MSAHSASEPQAPELPAADLDDSGRPSVIPTIDWAVSILNAPGLHDAPRVSWAGRYLAAEVTRLQAREEQEHWTPGLLALWAVNLFLAGGVFVAFLAYWLFIK